MSTIQEVATITSKGQITLPKSIRQLLGVDAGSKIAFDLQQDGRITVSRVPIDHEDPAIHAFLSILAKDIQTGRHIQRLPDELTRSMLSNADYNVNLDEDIDGEVAF